MEYPHNDSSPCSKSEVDLFSIPHTQIAVQDTQTLVVTPINTVSGVTNTPIELLIPGSSEYFLDLSTTALYLKIRITRPDGSALPASYPIAPANNFLHTFFNQVEVCVNGKKLSSSACNYAYRTYLEKHLNYSVTSKRTHQSCNGYFSESERSAVLAAAHANDNKVFEYYGRIHADFFLQDRLLLNSCDVRIKLTRSPSSFHLIRNATLPDGMHAIDAIAVIEECEMYVRSVRLTNHLYLSIERSLTSTNAKYPIRRVETRAHTIPSQITYKAINNIVTGTLPQKVIIGLLEHTAEQGNYTRPCFKFEHFDLENVSLWINGQPLAKPYEVNFNTGNYLRPYSDLYTTNGFLGSHSNGITLDEYSSTSTLFSFDTSIDQSSNGSGHVNPVRKGEITIKFKFRRALQRPITLLVYMEYFDVIEISKSRTVMYEV